jgi:hypothetical protein
LIFLAKDHAAFDIDLVKFAGWDDIGQTSCADLLKGGNTENCDSMGKPCREVARLFYTTFSSTLWNFPTAMAEMGCTV